MSSVGFTWHWLKGRMHAGGGSSSSSSAHPAPSISSTAQADAKANRLIIRVFVSSTFRDMKREWDLLVKKIFPELRRKCWAIT